MHLYKSESNPVLVFFIQKFFFFFLKNQRTCNLFNKTDIAMNIYNLYIVLFFLVFEELLFFVVVLISLSFE